eukprot:14202265-Heterocapsa_arctica.AAC.1
MDLNNRNKRRSNAIEGEGGDGIRVLMLHLSSPGENPPSKGGDHSIEMAVICKRVLVGKGEK